MNLSDKSMFGRTCKIEKRKRLLGFVYSLFCLPYG